MYCHRKRFNTNCVEVEVFHRVYPARTGFRVAVKGVVLFYYVQLRHPYLTNSMEQRPTSKLTVAQPVKALPASSGIHFHVHKNLPSAAIEIYFKINLILIPCLCLVFPSSLFPSVLNLYIVYYDRALMSKQDYRKPIYRLLHIINL
jgi:hypothetical protein